MARKAKTPKPLPRSYVTFLLDRSGSMECIKSATIEGFNTFLAGLQAEEGADIRFTFLQFDAVGYNTNLDKVYVASPVKGVPLLNNSTFVPRGGTPLIEAAYKTIKAVEEAVAKEEIQPKVIICIQTDGEENSSQPTYTWDGLAALVKSKQEQGWQFNFLGAGIDAYQQAARMSIQRGSTVSYNAANAGQTRSSFAATASNAVNYSTGAMGSTQYDVEQKFQSGDAFDPNVNVLADKLKKAAEKAPK